MAKPLDLGEGTNATLRVAEDPTPDSPAPEPDIEPPDGLEYTGGSAPLGGSVMAPKRWTHPPGWRRCAAATPWEDHGASCVCKGSRIVWADEEERHELRLRDNFVAGEWRALPQEKRRGGKPSTELPPALPPDWWIARSLCRLAPPEIAALPWPGEADRLVRDRCESPYCDPCRVRVLGRALQRGKASAARLLELEGARVWLVTATRRAYVRDHADLFRFAAGVKALDAALRAAGAFGAVWIYEVKVKHLAERSRIVCCEQAVTGDPGDPCPLCGDTGWVPAGHLHAHGIVMVPADWFLPFEWLSRMELCRSLDPEWGNVDVQRGELGGGIDGVWGYVGGYVQKLKEDLSAAWLRRMGGRWQTTRTTGALRGAAARKVTQVNLEIGGTMVHSVRRDWRVRDRMASAKCDVPAAYRDASRKLRARGFGEGIPECPWSRDRELLSVMARGRRRLPRLARRGAG